MTCFFPLSFFHHKVRKERKKFSAFAIKEIQWEYDKRGERFWTALVWRAIKTHLKKKPKKKELEEEEEKNRTSLKKKSTKLSSLLPKTYKDQRAAEDPLSITCGHCAASMQDPEIL